MQKNPSFGRHRGPREALIRGLVKTLVEKERIKTTLAKARCLRPYIERAITIGKKGDIHSRRILASRYPDKKTIQKIIKDLSPRFINRPGGFTRIIKLGPRPGDQTSLAFLEFVDYKMKAPVVKKSSEEKKTAKPVTTPEGKKIKKQQQRKIDTKRKRKRQQRQKSRRINRD